jgi:hypothetical protein
VRRRRSTIVGAEMGSNVVQGEQRPAARALGTSGAGSASCLRASASARG